MQEIFEQSTAHCGVDQVTLFETGIAVMFQQVVDNEECQRIAGCEVDQNKRLLAALCVLKVNPLCVP